MCSRLEDGWLSSGRLGRRFSAPSCPFADALRNWLAIVVQTGGTRCHKTLGFFDFLRRSFWNFSVDGSIFVLE